MIRIRPCWTAAILVLLMAGIGCGQTAPQEVYGLSPAESAAEAPPAPAADHDPVDVGDGRAGGLREVAGRSVAGDDASEVYNRAAVEFV